MNTRITKGLLVGLILLTTACGRQMDGNVYTSSATTGKVLKGTVISAMPVKIKDSDKLGNNVVGGVAGGVGGGLAGSLIGGGRGNDIATVGGVVAGAVLGSLLQDKLSTSDGMQYVVQLDSSQKKERKAKVKKIEYSGGKSVDREISDSTQVAETESDAISVVQGKEPIIAVGQRVLVMYNDDRTRIIPAGM
jgi:outer membrane lipoprotein SlyB